MTTTAKIASKGTKSTGITDDIAKRLHDQLGKTVIAIVEISSEARTENKAGDEQVKLVINTIEVAPTDITEDHLRELARSFHYERQLADGQPTLDDDIEPKVTDVLAAGQRHKPHPFLPDDAAKDNPICDVCGGLDDASIHADRTTLVDQFAAPDDDEPEPPAA